MISEDNILNWMNENKRGLTSLFTALLVPFGFWLLGYDFNERGFVGFLCFLLFICLWAFVYFMPLWPKKSK